MKIIKIILCIVSVIFLSLEIYVFFSKDDLESNNIEKFITSVSDINVEKSNQISSSAKYKQSISVKLKSYLTENKLEIANDLSIDLNDIIKSENCSGKVTFKVIDEIIYQNYDIKCSDDNSNKSDFQIYSFSSDNVRPLDLYNVNNGYVLISQDINNDYSNGINVTLYDKDFMKKWNYFYENDELKYNNFTSKEDKSMYIKNYSFIENSSKYYVSIKICNYKNYCNDRLLILNSSEGSLVKNKRFEDTDIYNIINIIDNKVYFNGASYYIYDVNTDNISKIENSTDENILNIKKNTSDSIYALSSISNYMSTDEEGNEEIKSRGTNSIYLFNSSFKLKKQLNLDKTSFFKINDEALLFCDFVFNDNGYIYITYSINYNFGILVLDKEFNLVNNIFEPDNTNSNIASGVMEISDIYVYNSKLYVLTNVFTTNNINVSVYEEDGSKLLSRKTYESFNNEEFRNEYDYSISEKKVLYGDDKGVTYYIIMNDINTTNDDNTLNYIKIDSYIY